MFYKWNFDIPTLNNMNVSRFKLATKISTQVSKFGLSVFCTLPSNVFFLFFYTDKYRKCIFFIYMYILFMYPYIFTHQYYIGYIRKHNLGP